MDSDQYNLFYLTEYFVILATPSNCVDNSTTIYMDNSMIPSMDNSTITSMDNSMITFVYNSTIPSVDNSKINSVDPDYSSNSMMRAC